MGLQCDKTLLPMREERDVLGHRLAAQAALSIACHDSANCFVIVASYEREDVRNLKPRIAMRRMECRQVLDTICGVTLMRNHEPGLFSCESQSRASA